LKVLALSDIHRSVYMVKKALEFAAANALEVVTCSGDFQSLEAIKVLSGFKGKVFAVPGNMDGGEELEALEEAGVSLHGKVAEHGGFLFAGAGALNFKWALQAVTSQLNNIEPNKFVFITHYPPKDSKVDVAFNLAHVGSSSVREFIESYRPAVCLCGHIHEARGVDWLGETLLVNPGPLARGYAAIVDVAKRQAELIEVGTLE